MDPRALLLLLAQDSAPASRPDPPLPPEVAEIVEKAARAQFPDGREAGEVRDFSLTFDFIVRDEERSNEVTAEHAFALPNRVRTQVRDAATRVTVATGFDGRRYWVRDDKGTTILEGREHRDARQEIDERVRLSRDLAAVFSIRRLVERLGGVRRLADETEEGHPLAVLEGESAAFGPVRRAGVERVRLRVRIDRETGDLFDVLATPLPAGEDGPRAEPERFQFFEFRVQAGVRLPGRITVTIGAAERPNYVIGRIRGLRLNPGLPDETFAPPG
ncbi:MAG TPA: hypothetical protein VFI25_03350 [Planctomycetota bacterium]|jgi:hypothetical protein|nr:hypothetical protein [Planctomycetota bacterium]